MRYKLTDMFHRELKKGSAELLILSLLEDRPRHGYDLGQLIERQSEGALRFKAASLYPLCTGWSSAAGSRDDGSRRTGSAAAGSTV